VAGCNSERTGLGGRASRRGLVLTERFEGCWSWRIAASSGSSSSHFDLLRGVDVEEVVLDSDAMPDYCLS
jgi:hypothetical protein